MKELDMAITMLVIVSIKNHQWMLKRVGKIFMRNRILHSLKALPHKVSITNINSTMKKSDGYHLNQVIEVNTTIMGQTEIICFNETLRRTRGQRKQDFKKHAK